LVLNICFHWIWVN